MKTTQLHFIKLLIQLGDDEFQEHLDSVETLHLNFPYRKKWSRLIKYVGLKASITAIKNFLPCVLYLHAMPKSEQFLKSVYTINEMEYKYRLINSWLETPNNKEIKQELKKTIMWFEEIHSANNLIRISENIIDLAIMAIVGRDKFDKCILSLLDHLQRLNFPTHVVEKEFKRELIIIIRERLIKNEQHNV